MYNLVVCNSLYLCKTNAFISYYIKSIFIPYTYHSWLALVSLCHRNNKKISSAYSSTETKKATMRLLRTVVVLTQSLQSLPDNVMMTMKLLYYDDGR